MRATEVVLSTKRRFLLGLATAQATPFILAFLKRLHEPPAEAGLFAFGDFVDDDCLGASALEHLSAHGNVFPGKGHKPFVLAD